MKKMSQKKQDRFIKRSTINALTLSKELLELMERDYDSVFSYGKKNCKTCGGTGYSHVTIGTSAVLKKVPCDCALRRKMKALEGQKNKPIWAVVRHVNGKDVYEFTYAKSKLPNYEPKPDEGIFHGKEALV